MKKILLVLSLLFISMKVLALDANYDSSTGIVFFPRVSVDKTLAYSNLELLLKPDLTWSILSFDSEPSENIEEGEPNYDSSTSIVSFPRVTVDNSTAYTVELLLNGNGTYAILSIEELLTNNLTGNYIGSIQSNDKQQFNSQLVGTLTQNGDMLAGEVNITNVFIGDARGMVTGSVNGNTVSFTVDIGGSIINFDGIISNDNKSLSGNYEWDILTFNNTGTWEYVLQ